MHSLPFACFNCRKSFKVEWNDFSPGKNDPKVLGQRCPECAGQLVYAGRYFKAPPKNALKQWRKVALLFQRGWRADSLSGGPKTLCEVPAFLQPIEARDAEICRQTKRREIAERRRLADRLRLVQRRRDSK